MYHDLNLHINTFCDLHQRASYDLLMGNANTCNLTGCEESTRRLMCNRIFTTAKFRDVWIICPHFSMVNAFMQIDANNYFPFLSYGSMTPLANKSYPAPSSSSNKKLRLAYMLLVHENFDQTVRLLEAIYHPDNWYMIHVDHKVPTIKASLVKYSQSFSNIFVLEKSFDIGWGGPEMVFATLEGMFGLLDVSKKWDFIINLSTKDYPLCSDSQLSEYLETRLGKNFDVGVVPPRTSEKFW